MGLTVHSRGLFYSRERDCSIDKYFCWDTVGTDGEKSRKKIKKSYSSLHLHYLLTHKTCSESKHTQNSFCLLARSSATSRLQFPMFYQSPRWIHFLFFFIFSVRFLHVDFFGRITTGTERRPDEEPVKNAMFMEWEICQSGTDRQTDGKW